MQITRKQDYYTALFPQNDYFSNWPSVIKHCLFFYCLLQGPNQMLSTQMQGFEILISALCMRNSSGKQGFEVEKGTSFSFPSFSLLFLLQKSRCTFTLTNIFVGEKAPGNNILSSKISQSYLFFISPPPKKRQ